jgi:hypothetical protein
MCRKVYCSASLSFTGTNVEIYKLTVVTVNGVTLRCALGDEIKKEHLCV